MGTESPPELPDDGCRWGGPSCLACQLPKCVLDMTRAEHTAFRVEQRRLSGSPVSPRTQLRRRKAAA